MCSLSLNVMISPNILIQIEHLDESQCVLPLTTPCGVLMLSMLKILVSPKAFILIEHHDELDAFTLVEHHDES